MPVGELSEVADEPSVRPSWPRLRCADTGDDWSGDGLAGQLTARSERPKCYWTLRFGLGFGGATPEGFIEVGADLKTMAGEGMANPATRFHLWVLEARPDVNSIIHTHSPWASALAAEREPLVISQMGHNTASGRLRVIRHAKLLHAETQVRKFNVYRGSSRRPQPQAESPA